MKSIRKKAIADGAAFGAVTGTIARLVAQQGFDWSLLIAAGAGAVTASLIAAAIPEAWLRRARL
ncbi:hypothetical protein ACWD4L_46885 [Streptomyces sp. NPDC002596]